MKRIDAVPSDGVGFLYGTRSAAFAMRAEAHKALPRKTNSPSTALGILLATGVAAERQADIKGYAMTRRYLRNLAAGAALALSAVTAMAGIVEMRVTINGTTTTITDNGLGDVNAAAGVITFLGTNGVLSVNVDTGSGSPPNLFPELMHLDVIATSLAPVPDNLQVEFTQTDLNFGSTPFDLAALAGGVAGVGSTVSFSLLADANNAKYVGQTIFSGSTGTGLIGASGADLFDPGADGLFSLTQVVRFSFNTAGQSSSMNFSARIPEPGALALAGLALLAVGTTGRRRR